MDHAKIMGQTISHAGDEITIMGKSGDGKTFLVQGSKGHMPRHATESEQRAIAKMLQQPIAAT